jgi:hypothetical protein
VLNARGCLSAAHASGIFVCPARQSRSRRADSERPWRTQNDSARKRAGQMRRERHSPQCRGVFVERFP